MMTGQAIGNIVTNRMDLTPKSGSTETSVAKSNDAISFDKLLSRSYHDQVSKPIESQTDKKVISNTKVSNSDTITNSKVNKVQSNQNEVSKTSELNQSDSKLEDVANVVEEAKEIVMEELNLTEEELVSIMETLGLSMIDLLNPDKLLQLTLECAGVEDASMLLTDHSLGLQLANMVKDITQLMQDYNVSSEDIQSIVQDEAEFANLMNLLHPTAEDIVRTEDAEVSNKADGLAQAGQEESEGTKMDFTVVKESDSAKAQGTTSSETEAQTSSDGKSGQDKTQAVTQFVDQIVANASTTQEVNFSEQLSEIHQLLDIANQIIDAVKITIKPTQTSMEFNLNPEHLGRIALSITSKEGVITASFITQNQLAKEAIESQMQVLKDNLNNQGVKVEAIEVTVSQFGFDQSNEMGQGKNQQNSSSSNGKKVFRADLGSLAMEEEEEILQTESLDSGSQIDYSA